MRFNYLIDNSHGVTLTLDYQLRGMLTSPHLLVFFNGLFHGESSWVKQQRCGRLNDKLMLFIDYPGCGQASLDSTAASFSFDDIARALQGLIEHIQQQRHIQTSHFIGYSLGGMLANRVASLMATPPDSLSFINSAPSIGLKAHWLIHNVLQMLSAKLEPEILFSQVYPWFFSEQYLNKIKGMSEYVLKSYVDYNHDLTGLARFLTACLTQRHPPELSTIPSLMISCDGDPLFPPEVVNPWHRYPQLTPQTLNLSSHVANLEASTQVNLWLGDFIHQRQHQHQNKHNHSNHDKECQHG
ncbi:alpha/beta fold hydrolase [Motilimonas sp. KMU-193]|uniref:alpha/beta fold hydrolase n=1 Tax=Motilimonas sp. KMU-193 TaxID=3388668 RepID=UPI00396B431D